MSTDYTADAPDFHAWAGTGAAAERIYSLGGDALTELRATYNQFISAAVTCGTDPADAMSSVDIEQLTERVLADLDRVAAS